MKPTESNFVADLTAWQVIKDIGYNSWHKFTYTKDTSVVATWDNGRSDTFPLKVIIGKSYSLENTPGGFLLVDNNKLSSDNEFDVINKVSIPGGISVTAFKDRSPIATKHNVGRNQKAEFVLHPKLYFGVTSEYETGDIVDSAAIGEDFTEISLEGLSNATIILKGNAAHGYSFELFHDLSVVAA